MTDRYENIRKALAMGPTLGPWRVNGTQSVRGAQGEYIAKTNWNNGPDNAAYIAACDPDTIRELLAERDQLAAALEAEQEEVFALQDEVEVAWEECDALRAEVSELRAARIAYASEFPETKDGGPDTGNIHANIRSLKARAERLEEALREARDAIEDWAGYVSEYFREKHDLAGDLAKIDAVLSKENSND